MKKSLIALAVASAFVAPAAMAETTIYGNMHVSFDRADDGANTGAVKTNQLNSNESTLGFKGSEDLGGGMSAIWQIGSDIMADDGSGTSLGSHTTFVGVKSDSMGTVVVGNYDTPYKSSTRGLDVFATTTADNRTKTGTGAQGMGFGHDLKAGNSLNYMSPDMGGLSVALSTVFGAESKGTTPGFNAKGSLTSLAAMYTMDNIYATLAIQNAKAGDSGTGDLAEDGSVFDTYLKGATAVAGDKASATKLGGGYTMDAIAVNLVYEMLSYKTAAGVESENTNIYLAGKYNLDSSNAVKLAYTKVGDTETGATTTVDGAKQISVGVDHSMSKNTMVYALYTKVDGNGAASAAPTALSFGLKHSF